LSQACPSIPSADVRAALALLNELHGIADLEARKTHLLRRLCEMLGAKVAMVSFVRDAGPGWQFQPVSCCDSGWQDESERAAVMSFRERDLGGVESMRDPMDVMLSLAGPVKTFRRDDLHEHGRWYQTGNVNEIRRGARIDDCIYSLHRLPTPGWTVGLGIHRAWGDRVGFTARERALVHLIHEQLTWMWQQDAEASTRASTNGAAAAGEDLPPRLRQTLQLLLAGNSEKEAATTLGLSRATLHKYVTALYRHFHVSSRPELLAKLLGDKNSHGSVNPLAMRR